MRQSDLLRPSCRRFSRAFSLSISIRMRRSRLTTLSNEQTVLLLELVRSTLTDSLSRSLLSSELGPAWLCAVSTHSIPESTRRVNASARPQTIWLANRVPFAQQGSSFQFWFREMWRFSWRHIDTLSNSPDCWCPLSTRHLLADSGID
jgi:hypothetical protein